MNLFPLYRGIPFNNKEKERLDAYVQMKTIEALDKTDTELIDSGNKDRIMSGVLSRVGFLSEYFGFSIGAVSYLQSSAISELNQDWHEGDFVDRLLDRALKGLGLHYVSINVPSEYIPLIRVLEENGFRYTEGFINMIQKTNWCKEPPGNQSRFNFRYAVRSDLQKIEQAYRDTPPFPSRFVTEAGFDDFKALMLYPNRFRQVFESGECSIIVADYKTDYGWLFGGAIIVGIDQDIYAKTDLRLNLRSGLGLIVNPRLRKYNIGSALVAYRQKLFHQMDVPWVSLGANLSNRPMITCLEKLGFMFGCQELTMARWL